MEQIELQLEAPLSEIDLRRKAVLGDEWFHILRDVLNAPKVREVANFVGARRKAFGVTVYPKQENTFRAFNLTQFKSVKVVILGQDPYHNGSADGLAFSTQTKEIPKSLDVIFNAITMSKTMFPVVSDLEEWAKQGVLLLNTCLTVEEGQAGSHVGKGWEELTSYAIRSLSKLSTPICYLLWGKEAKEFRRYIVNPAHLVIECEHPAASLHQKRAWEFGNCFNKCDEYLLANGSTPVKWDAVNDSLPF